MTLGRSGIAGKIASETGLSRRLIIRLLNSFTEEIGAAVSRGERVELRNFGVFSRRELGPRVMRNPQTGNRMRAPAKSAMKFKPCKKFRNI